MSRADKKNTRITYELRLDEKNERIEELIVTVLTAKKSTTRVNGGNPFTDEEHVAFITHYRFTARDEVERFAIPPAVVPFLR